MNGITILSTVHEQFPLIKLILVYVSISGISMLAVSLFLLLYHDGLYFDTKCEIMFIVGIFLTLVFLPIGGAINNVKYVYAVMNSDTPIKEISGKYEIMDVDGDLYKLKIIEAEEDD